MLLINSSQAGADFAYNRKKVCLTPVYAKYFEFWDIPEWRQLSKNNIHLRNTHLQNLILCFAGPYLEDMYWRHINQRKHLLYQQIERISVTKRLKIFFFRQAEETDEDFESCIPLQAGKQQTHSLSAQLYVALL